MTFCFAFANPADGVGLVTDKRVSSITTFGDLAPLGDGALKIFSPNKYCVFAMAGTTALLGELLADLDQSFFDRLAPGEWHDAVRSTLGAKYTEVLNRRTEWRVPAVNAQVIYADVRRRRGHNFARLLKLSFSYKQPKQAVTRITQGQGVESCWIGSAPHIRRRLGEAGLAALREIASSPASVRELSAAERAALPSHVDLSGDPTVFVMDRTQGSHFARDTRLARDTLRRAGTSGLQILALGASKAIQSEYEQIRSEGDPLIIGISPSFHVSTLETDLGLRIGSI